MVDIMFVASSAGSKGIGCIRHVTRVAKHTNRSMNETRMSRIDHSGSVALRSRPDTCGHDTTALSSRRLLRPSTPDPSPISHVDLSVLFVMSEVRAPVSANQSRRNVAPRKLKYNDMTSLDATPVATLITYCRSREMSRWRRGAIS